MALFPQRFDNSATRLEKGRGRPFYRPSASQSNWSNGVHLEALGNLAHELRTPVQVLLGYLDILRGAPTGGVGDISHAALNQEIIERMNSNVHELAQTVENVMEFAVSESETASVPEEIQLTEFFAELDPIFRAGNRNENLTVRVDLDRAPQRVLLARHPLRAVVVNLISNAIKFTPAGEVTITVREIHGATQGVEIAVRDTGPGISSSLLSHAFRPMVQLSGSSVRHHRGLGLGLAVVQRNVEVLGASLEVESTHRGSCFRVTIPCSLFARCVAV
jgi:signal transduction histidine kinase